MGTAERIYAWLLALLLAAAPVLLFSMQVQAQLKACNANQVVLIEEELEQHRPPCPVGLALDLRSSEQTGSPTPAKDQPTLGPTHGEVAVPPPEH